MSANIHASIDLSSLPPPQIIETLDFEIIFEEILILWQTLNPDYTLLLESDPNVKLMQAWAYREMIDRARINEGCRNQLLSFATGNNLDHLASFYNVLRLPGQSDDSFRVRIQSRITAFSNAGGIAHYRYWALSSDPRVLDVAVYSPDGGNHYNMGGCVEIAVLSNEDSTLAPSVDLLGVVQDFINRTDIKMLTDIVEVVAAGKRSVTISLNVRLFPDASYDTLGKVLTAIQTQFAVVQALGRDITPSWVSSVAHISGVHSVVVTSPTTDFVIAPNEYPVLANVTVGFLGLSDSEGVGIVATSEAQLLRKAHEFYVKAAISNSLTKDQIKADLVETPNVRVIQPTVRTLCDYLNISGTKDTTTGDWLPEDELCFLIWFVLSQKYVTTVSA